MEMIARRNSIVSKIKEIRKTPSKRRKSLTKADIKNGYVTPVKKRQSVSDDHVHPIRYQVLNIIRQTDRNDLHIW